MQVSKSPMYGNKNRQYDTYDSRLSKERTIEFAQNSIS